MSYTAPHLEPSCTYFNANKCIILKFVDVKTAFNWMDRREYYQIQDDCCLFMS